MILVDASGIFAAISEDQREHEECKAAVLGASEPLMISPFVLAELDYMITKSVGVDTELKVLEDVVRGAYRLAEFHAQDIDEAREVISRYRELRIGLADASIVVLSRKFNVLDLLTLDRRHFSALRGARGHPFRLLPA